MSEKTEQSKPKATPKADLTALKKAQKKGVSGGRFILEKGKLTPVPANKPEEAAASQENTQ